MSIINKPVVKASDSFTSKSSFIELVAYDAKASTLTVTFKGGNQRVYQGISAGTFESFKSAKSHGAYYSKLIKGQESSAPVQSHNISTVKKTQPYTKAPKEKLYGSQSLNRSSRPGRIPDSL